MMMLCTRVSRQETIILHLHSKLENNYHISAGDAKYIVSGYLSAAQDLYHHVTREL